MIVRDHEVERRAHQTCAQLAEVVAEGHPAALADRVAGPAAEQPDDAADAHRGRSDGARRLGVLRVGPRSG